ncbi:MarR family winged helix-turn-helix transcriptional regulator [Undibacterium sp. JH2W]|uniref:MarR family winged helix-turn-helix transcriptional regulator n=1 Tax=Undibacterium sp. JH2W TaxID=3413037 RepID=UPI003BEFE800
MQENTDLGVLLNLAFGSFKEQLHQHLAQQGYADIGSSFGYVFRLLKNNPQNLKQVADSLAMTPQGALKIINDMVLKAYVQREDDAHDARVRLLHLTPRALALMDVAHAFHQEFESRLSELLGAGKVKAMRALLEQIVADGDKAADGLPKLRPL